MKRESSTPGHVSAPPRPCSTQGDDESSPTKRLKMADIKDEPDFREIGILHSLAAKEFGPEFNDWPAPRRDMEAARQFLLNIIDEQLRVLIIPDKDADGLSAGTLLFRTLVHLGLPPDRIQVQHLSKGNNVHSADETRRIAASKADMVIVLDQGSRGGASLYPDDNVSNRTRVLIIDHHFSYEWPDHSLVLTACHSPPIVTTSVLTYLLLRDLDPTFVQDQGWRALVGLIGDLGPKGASWGKPPWPSELSRMNKQKGSKVLADAVSAVNAPRRTAEYNVPRAWKILLDATGPAQVASHAYLKVCKIDVSEETARWARTRGSPRGIGSADSVDISPDEAPRFSEDGKIALIAISTGFQIHPVIATRWAGTLGRKSGKLVMVMCANTGYNPDGRVSFSCRISATLRKLDDDKRPDLIAMLKKIGGEIPGFLDRVGGDFARGHKEATGGIIPKHSQVEFDLMTNHLGIGKPPSSKSLKNVSPGKKQVQIHTINRFFKTVPKA